MPSGNVSAGRRALINIDILDREGRTRPLEVALDTGFTGYLTLPAPSIAQLGLAYEGVRTFALANGEFQSFDSYEALVVWHGSPRAALVLQADAPPLIGMQLLWGSRVTMDALTGGAVEIEELTGA
jgi:predicted aspartyl protease